MVFINTEGKFNENSYLIDGLLFNIEKIYSVYVIENNGMRMLIDTTSENATIKIIEKLKKMDLYPIHKILLTHSHMDHIQGVNLLKKKIKGTDLEVLASENALENLKNPDRINSEFDHPVEAVENVIALKEGDIIDLNGLNLEVINFFGHTMDSIAIFDSKNKNIFIGDAIIDRINHDTFQPTFMPTDFNEGEIIKTFQKLKRMRNKINSICLSHFGVWADEDCDKILNEMEDLHFQTKDSIINWYNENPSIEYIASKYYEKFIPHSKNYTRENLKGLQMQLKWLIKGLKASKLMP